MVEVALRRAFVAATALWAGTLVVATRAAADPHPGGIQYLFSATVYLVGSVICHQRPERSFHFWGAQFPVCARCAGIYVGAVIAAIAAAIRGKGDTSYVPRSMVAIAVLPTVVTLMFEWTTGVMPGNWIRAAAGFPLGAAVAWATVRVR